MSDQINYITKGDERLIKFNDFTKSISIIGGFLTQIERDHLIEEMKKYNKIGERIKIAHIKCIEKIKQFDKEILKRFNFTRFYGWRFRHLHKEGGQNGLFYFSNKMGVNDNTLMLNVAHIKCNDELEEVLQYHQTKFFKDNIVEINGKFVWGTSKTNKDYQQVSRRKKIIPFIRAAERIIRLKYGGKIVNGPQKMKAILFDWIINQTKEIITNVEKKEKPYYLIPPLISDLGIEKGIVKFDEKKLDEWVDRGPIYSFPYQKSKYMNVSYFPKRDLIHIWNVTGENMCGKCIERKFINGFMHNIIHDNLIEFYNSYNLSLEEEKELK